MLSPEAHDPVRAAVAAPAPLSRAAGLIGAACAAAVIGVGACGEDEDTSLPSVVEPGTGGSSLTIRLDRDGPGGAAEEEESVECGVPGASDSPACPAIEALPDDPLAPVPPDMACTEIYGGPDVVTVRGTLRGEEVDGTLTRANGCEIERFDRFLPVLRELFPGYRPGEAIQP